MERTKSTNQYYGKFFEKSVASIINGEINAEDFGIPNEEKEEILKDANKCADFINGTKAEWVGNHTSNENCDLVVDGKHIELKYVSAGNGTYFNTSIYYFTKFGFDFKDYLKKYGVYEAIESLGYAVSRKNNSPVSQSISSEIRHTKEKEYKETVVVKDEMARNNFVKDISNYFSANKEKLIEFINDMISKNSLTVSKGSPDKLIVYNYKNKVIKSFDNFSNESNINELKITDKGLVINGYRVAISWQNGLGLNNPTIRFFL